MLLDTDWYVFRYVTEEQASDIRSAYLYPLHTR